MTEKNDSKVALTPEQIKQITEEIQKFQELSLQHASTSRTLSAHYHKLYTASKDFLRRVDRIQRIQQNKEYQEKRRVARNGGSTSTSSSSGAPKTQKA